MIRVRISDNPGSRSAASGLNPIEYLLIRQGSLVNVCPERCHASDPTKATDISVGSLYDLYSEQIEIVEPVKLKLKAILVRQLCQDVVLNVSHRISGKDVLRGVNPQLIRNPSNSN